MSKILALGAENKTRFAVKDGEKIFLSDVYSDLSIVSVLESYEKDIRTYLAETGMKPEIIACDAHPAYHSRWIAENLSREYASEVLFVQHHEAHILSCMADNNITGDVLGVAFDGAGYGNDGAIWGGEFLLQNGAALKRLNHFSYVEQPGGDIASREIWRMAVSYLNQAYSGKLEKICSAVLNGIGKEKICAILDMISKKINVPLTSSVGRLFDAVSCLVLGRIKSDFEAECAILLEKSIVQGVNDYYGYEISGGSICVSKMIREIIRDMEEKISAGIVSAKFHNTIGEIIFDIARRTNKEFGITKVLVSGGCFQNKYLMEYVEKKFSSEGSLKLYKHNKYSPSDLGIAIGQIVYAERVSGE
ncbi:[NiFe] hydrogenase maturation protein HypF [Candidatus Omnitrophus magneticus]|uniref:[NiFe] hydrogenase maturation protein HypF n=1 Tax=Candidatus Omnitrophus magneticus TaxID=1609969 RepID=A0A0F0CU11_9BACT|nr:[NiFe] hydrogenase maturation protein HypF [Candidatus Omnitrophus magneticus]